MTIKRKMAHINASLALTVFVAAPALADDTELLLTSVKSDLKPNINFILDTSGSMNTLEHTIAFYDSSVVYAGTCNTDYFYWSNSGSPPSCSGVKRAIAKASFVCEAAAGQVGAIGSYTGVVAQYRDKWRELKEGNLNSTIECAADSGKHGNGTVGEVYAQTGKSQDEFTANPAREIDWESSPTNETYSLFTGNYLNWRANPPDADLKRIDIVKTVLKKILSSYDDLNLSMMRFNNTEGGAVIHAMQDLRTSRASLFPKIDAITAVGNTPLSETFYEAALYWQGLEAHYGELFDAIPTDPDALSTLEPEIYQAPSNLEGVCRRNYNVFLTDGLPKNDADTLLLAPTLPGWEAALGEGRTTCDDYSIEGDCLDDISEYLFKHDIDPVEPGQQFVQSFGAGFLMPAENTLLLTETMEISGGEFFNATDPEGLAIALLSIFDQITEQSLTFVAPTVAVNAFNRTQNLNNLYMSVFQSSISTHWPGNLKKYRVVDGEITDVNGAAAVDPLTGFLAEGAKSFWTVGAADGSDVTMGGAANVLPDPATRNLYTNNGGGTNLTSGNNVLTDSNDSAFIVGDFGLTGDKDDPSIAEIINWARGEDIADEDGNPATTTRYAMGDPLHAQPAAVDYGTGGASDVIVYSATNDGYLHAIDADTGVELWSFVPKELLVNFGKLFVNPSEKSKQYGIDGDITPVVFDEDKNGQIDGLNDFVYIVFGMRRGGDSYYALDVTNKTSPKLMWNVTYPEFGQSWSAPVISRVDTTEAALNSNKAVAIIGAGYNTVHDSQSAPGFDDVDGAGIFMLDLKTGATIWRAGADALANLTLDVVGREMNRAFPSKIQVIDINGDGFADRMYAADLGGQLWRFDISAGEPASSLVAGGIIARLGFEGNTTPVNVGPSRIYNSPDIALITDPQQNRRYISVSIGTGYRAHPLNTTAADTFYSLRDPDVFNGLSQADYNTYNIATPADLVEVSGKLGTVITSANRGWKFTMPADQMVLSDSITFDDSVFFVGFSPAETGLIECDPTLGRNFLYRVNVINGDPVVPNIAALLPADSDAARTTYLRQGGIAPKPTILFPSPDPTCTGAACYPPPLGCVGVECFDPGFRNLPVRTLWTQDGIE